MKEKASLQQESQQLQEQLAKIDDRMTKIKDLKDKVMSVKDAVDNNNQETIEFSTNNFIFYCSVLTDKAFILPNHLVKSNKLLASFEPIV